MKTLDEVIEAIEVCRDSYVAGKIIKSDALHYLKDYRSDKAMWEADRKGYLDWIEQYKEAREKHQQAVIELKKNPPLTWQELQTMEGKPVWVEQTMIFEEGTPEEYQQDVKEWMIVSNIGHRCIDMVNVNDGELRFDRSDLTWQAYRKERS